MNVPPASFRNSRWRRKPKKTYEPRGCALRRSSAQQRIIETPGRSISRTMPLDFPSARCHGAAAVRHVDPPGSYRRSAAAAWPRHRPARRVKNQIHRFVGRRGPWGSKVDIIALTGRPPGRPARLNLLRWDICVLPFLSDIIRGAAGQRPARPATGLHVRVWTSALFKSATILYHRPRRKDAWPNESIWNWTYPMTWLRSCATRIWPRRSRSRLSWNSFANTAYRKGRPPNYLAYIGVICFRWWRNIRSRWSISRPKSFVKNSTNPYHNFISATRLKFGTYSFLCESE